MKAPFSLVFDNGKPDELKALSKSDLILRLCELEVIHDKYEWAHFDITIYDADEKDVTDEAFKDFNMRLGRLK